MLHNGSGFKNSTASFINSFHKCLLSTYYAPGTRLDAGDRIIKAIQSKPSRKLTFFFTIPLT